MSQPLAGVTVLDLSSVAFGPYGTQILADQGAEVIKIEMPEGDSTRYTGPARHHGMSAMFLGLNAGKKSVVLDLKRAPDREALIVMIGRADVLIHNIRPQKLAKLGIDFETVRSINPKLIYAALTGFREDGPYAGRPAYDDIVQGMCGISDLLERQHGEPGYLPLVLADKTCGLAAAQAICAALLGRVRTGEGGHIEVPMFETMVSYVLVEHWFERWFEERGEIGYPRALVAERRPYRTRDGLVCLMPYNDHQWRSFFSEVGEPQLASDARFATMDGRTRHIGLLYDLVMKHVATRTTDAWLETCDRLQIPAARVIALESLQDDPHLKTIGFFRDVEHPTEGRLHVPGRGVRFDHVDAPAGHAPTLGQHSAEVLAQFDVPPDIVRQVLGVAPQLTA